jgi:hypothetical protein
LTGPADTAILVAGTIRAPPSPSARPIDGPWFRNEYVSFATTKEVSMSSGEKIFLTHFAKSAG